MRADFSSTEFVSDYFQDDLFSKSAYFKHFVSSAESVEDRSQTDGSRSR